MQESNVFLVRAQCRRKESSRSLSHLLMSFLLPITVRVQLHTTQPLTNTITTKTIAVKPTAIIAIKKIINISIITVTVFELKLTTSLLVSPAVVQLLFDFLKINIKNNSRK